MLFFVEPNTILTSRERFLATAPSSTPLLIGIIGINEEGTRKE
jgi:hypothetical protein